MFSALGDYLVCQRRMALPDFDAQVVATGVDRASYLSLVFNTYSLTPSLSSRDAFFYFWFILSMHPPLNGCFIALLTVTQCHLVRVCDRWSALLSTSLNDGVVLFDI